MFFCKKKSQFLYLYIISMNVKYIIRYTAFVSLKLKQRKQQLKAMGKSTVERLCRQALTENIKRVTYTFFNNSVFHSIEIGVEGECDYESQPRTVELWVHTIKPLEEIIEDPCIKMIVDNDDLGNEERHEWYEKTKEKGGHYDYHCPYFPKAWLEDFFPTVENHYKKEKPVHEQSLMEFALSHGCDYMDMSTGTIYRGTPV